jgi:hypothetical protein
MQVFSDEVGGTVSACAVSDPRYGSARVRAHSETGILPPGFRNPSPRARWALAPNLSLRTVNPNLTACYRRPARCVPTAKSRQTTSQGSEGPKRDQPLLLPVRHAHASCKRCNSLQTQGPMLRQPGTLLSLKNPPRSRRAKSREPRDYFATMTIGAGSSVTNHGSQVTSHCLRLPVTACRVEHDPTH